MFNNCPASRFDGSLFATLDLLADLSSNSKILRTPDESTIAALVESQFILRMEVLVETLNFSSKFNEGIVNCKSNPDCLATRSFVSDAAIPVIGSLVGLSIETTYIYLIFLKSTLKSVSAFPMTVMSSIWNPRSRVSLRRIAII
jgi:hypothetical protein